MVQDAPMASRINVCFHGIGDPGGRPDDESAYWIGRDVFRYTLDLAAGRDDVQLSFDDGNRSDLEIGLPELSSRGLTATFFVLADRFDRSDSLSGEDVRTLRDAGMSIGSHGMRHVPWRGLPADALHDELVTARDLIAAEVGLPVQEAACPLGRYDRRVLAALRSAGYSTVHTSDRAVARPGAWLQPRFSLRATDTIEDVRAVLGRHGRLQRARDALRIRVKSLR